MPEASTIEPLPPPLAVPKNQLIPTAFGIVLFVAALYLGRDIAIPFALAMLLAFALAPAADWLRWIGLPKLASVILAATLAFAVIGGVSFVFGSQLIQLANNLPSYQQTIQMKLRALRTAAPGGGFVDRVTSSLRDFGKELSDPAPSSAVETAPAAATRSAIPVVVEQPPMQPFAMVRAALGELLYPLMQTGLVIVFVIVMLLERDDLRDRLIKLVGAGGELQKSTEAFGEAGKRVSRYLLTQLFLNIGYGVSIGVGLFFIGVPNAVLWGLLMTVMKFIPYLGTPLAAFFPLVLAFGIDPTWSMVVWTVALFVTVEMIGNSVVEPWLFGTTTGLSSLAVIISAIFWSILWGPIGLVLATPLTVCVMVIGRYVPHLNFLDVLLGSEPVLAPEQRFYQRLLSANVEEAVDMAERYVADKSRPEFYEEVVIPALRLAENDRQRDTTDVAYRRTVADGVVAVLKEIAEVSKDQGISGSAADSEATPSSGPSVLCIGGRTELDRAAAEMVAHALSERGIVARVLPPLSISQDAIGQLDLTGVDIACLCYLDPQPYIFAKFVSKKLKRREPQMRIAICAWNAAPGTNSDDPTVRGAADAISASLDNTLRLIDGWFVKPGGETNAPGIPANELERLNALRELRLSSTGSTQLDVLAARVAEAFDMPIALVSLVESEDQLWAGAAGLPADLNAARKGAREVSVCAHVVEKGEMIVVEDVARDPRFSTNPFLLEKGIRFYAGAPLRTASNLVLGSLCVIDSKPRKFSKKEQKLLQVIADELMSKIEAECRRNEGGRNGAPEVNRTSADNEISVASGVTTAVSLAV